MLSLKHSLLIVLLMVSGLAQALDLTLYINKDSAIVDQNWVSACSFNDTDTFKMKNAIIELDVNEPLNLTLVNQDSLEHTFTVDGIVDQTIGAQSTLQFSFGISEAGTFRYYSNKTYGQMIGASGMILVGYKSEVCFFWNLFEMDRDLTHELASLQTTSIPSDFQPENFFINGAYFPNTVNDPDAYVEAQIGDTLIISIVNSGNMEHVLHFHGFHAETLHSTQPERLGWVKDTFPLDLAGTLTLKLIVDLEGIYPVHDHNLIAVTNTGFYPGGMITHIVVSP